MPTPSSYCIFFVYISFFLILQFSSNEITFGDQYGAFKTYSSGPESKALSGKSKNLSSFTSIISSLFLNPLSIGSGWTHLPLLTATPVPI